jgi:MFS family permease
MRGEATGLVGSTASGKRAKSKPKELPSLLRSLRHRNFQLFFGGQLISLTGTWMQSVAQSWLVYKLTGSAVLLGLVGFSSQIPVFLLAPWGGVLADRMNRRRILLATQTIAMILAFVLSALTLSHRVQVSHLFVLSALLGITNAFDIPARQAFVVDMVGKEDLINAIALNSSMVNGARIVGPAVAGLLVAAVGEGWCFLINAVSYVAVLAGLLAMNVPVRPRLSRHTSTLANIVEGFRYAGKKAPIRALLLLLGLVSLMGMPYAVLMPLFADQVLHGGASGLGILMGASGIGALIGALTLASRRGLRGLGRWVAVSAAGFGVFLMLFSASRNFLLSAALLIPAGFFFMLEMAASNTLIQSMVTDELRGRVMAVYSMMFMGLAPIGAVLAGIMAERVGAPRTIAIGGAFCVLGGGLFALRLPSLRDEARRLIVSQEMSGGNPPEEMTSENLSK